MKRSIQAVRKVDVINETLKSTHNSKQKTVATIGQILNVTSQLEPSIGREAQPKSMDTAILSHAGPPLPSLLYRTLPPSRLFICAWFSWVTSKCFIYFAIN